MKHTNRIAGIEIVFENVEADTIPADSIVNFSIDLIHRSIQFELDGILSDKTTFDRILRYNDIVWIKLCYEDGKARRINIPWLDATAGGEENALQKSWIKDNGNLCLQYSLP